LGRGDSRHTGWESEDLIRGDSKSVSAGRGGLGRGGSGEDLYLGQSGSERILSNSKRILQGLERFSIFGITLFGVDFRLHQELGKDCRIKQVHVFPTAGRVQVSQISHLPREKGRKGSQRSLC
jgi:hypothetical protein